ncbi:MAG: hypothetical protein VXY77_04020 [Pseudomonadota bacterium]|nr:hypothetical protein [Pseudomonadota bacterium]
MVSWFLCLLYSGFCQTNPSLSGFVDADVINIVSPVSGTVEKLNAIKGASVQSGTPLILMDHHLADIQISEAEAGLSVEQSLLQDMKKPYHDKQLALAEQKIELAKLTEQHANKELSRHKNIYKSGATTDKIISGLEFERDQAVNQIKMATLESDLIRSPTRSTKLKAQEAKVRMAQEAVRKAHWHKKRLTILATQDAWVQAAHIHQGDHVIAGQTLMSLLLKNQNVIFYLPSDYLGKFKLGDTLTVDCTACSSGQANVVISHIALKPEFSPPEVYTRSKIGQYVYYTEARWQDQADAQHFTLGQPLTIRLGAR